MIDTYEDIDTKIKNWSTPFADLADNLRPIIREQIKLNNSHGFLDPHNNLPSSNSRVDVLSNDSKQKIKSNNVIVNLKKYK